MLKYVKHGSLTRASAAAPAPGRDGRVCWRSPQLTGLPRSFWNCGQDEIWIGFASSGIPTQNIENPKVLHGLTVQIYIYVPSMHQLLRCLKIHRRGLYVDIQCLHKCLAKLFNALHRAGMGTSVEAWSAVVGERRRPQENMSARRIGKHYLNHPWAIALFPLRCDLGYIATSQPILQVGCDQNITKFRENEYETRKFLLKNLERY